MIKDKKISVSADEYTKNKLGLTGTVSEVEAQRIQKETERSQEFKTIMERDRLVVKRHLRD